MKTCKIHLISVKEVVNFDVFNIELHSIEDGDDLYYYDVESKLIHHNCLRKDFGMINEYFPQTDLLLQAYKINEFMPKFIVDLAKEENIRGKAVLVLGYTFKQDTDDTRDSLVPKLLQYIDRYNPTSVIIHDPNLPYGKFVDKFNKIEFDNISYEKLSDSLFDICFIGTNHSIFKKLEYKWVFAGNKNVIDIWNYIDNKFKGE